MGETGVTRSTPQIAGRRTPERRTYWIAAIVLFGSIAVLTAITLIASAGTKDGDNAGQDQQPGIERPHSIPQPGDGQAPQHPNDRGGWQQYLVLGLIVIALSTVGGLAWRSSRRAKAHVAEPGEAPATARERPAASHGPPA